MADNLKLQVILSALDKASGPLKRISGGSIGAAKALKEARDNLKQLNATQKDVSAWRTQRTAAAQTETALGAARQRVKELGQQMAATGVPTKALNRDMKAAARDATRLKQQHTQQQTALQGLRNKLTAAGISTKNLSQGERDLRNRIAATNNSISEQGRRMQRLTEQQKRLSRAKQQYEKTAGLAGSMAGSGAAGLATGSSILYAGSRFLAPGMQFDEDMAKVQALTRLSRDSAQLAELRAQARQLGADTMFSATDAAQGQGFLAMAGFTPAAIKAAMPAMLDVAKAGGVELAETADIASNILTGMNLQADQMNRVGDVLVGTFTRSNTSIAMLGDTLKYVGPVASSISQDIETVAAMAGKLGDAGIQGSMGGTALRAILNRLSAPPKAAAKALDQLGISAKDAQGNMRQMPDILTEIYAKTKDMGTADRAGILKGIAGEEAVSALQVLVKQAGTGELQKFIATLRETQGEAAKTAKIMGDNLVGELDELSSAWEDLGIQLFDQQNGALRGVVKSLTEVVGAVAAWVKENPTLAAGIAKTIAGIGVLMAVMGGLTLAIASILGPFAMVRYGMMLFGIKSLGAVAALKSVGSAILFIGRALMLNPIGLAITAIALAAYLIYKHWDKIVPYFQGLWAEIKENLNGGIGGWTRLIIDFSPLGLFYRAFAGVMSYFGVEMPGKFSEFGSQLMQGLVNGITNGLAGVKKAITGAGTAAIGWFKEKLGIRSPSRVFAQLGGFTMAGLAQGLLGGEGSVLKQLRTSADRVVGAGTDMLGGVSIDRRAPLAARSAAATSTGGNTYNFVINAAPGMDPAAIGREVQRQLAAADRQQQARGRARLGDQE